MKTAQKGFTLIELMIVIAIIGILAAIAVPQYATYTKRAKFSEVILAVTSFKTPTEIAVQTGSVTAVADLDAGSFGIPNTKTTSATLDSDKPVGANVASVDMANGIITATGTTAAFGTGTAATYQIEAELINGGVRWSMLEGSTCLDLGLCAPTNLKAAAATP